MQSGLSRYLQNILKIYLKIYYTVSKYIADIERESTQQVYSCAFITTDIIACIHHETVPGYENHARQGAGEMYGEDDNCIVCTVR